MTNFRLWSPTATAARVHVHAAEADDSVYPLRRTADGWWISDVEARPGDRYKFSILPEGAGDSSGGVGAKDEDDAAEDAANWVGPFPDPLSPRQPGGVHDYSEVWEPSYTFTDDAWTGRPLAGSVLYELHVGTFTPEGTFAAAADRLEYLKELGVTTVELMPVTPFGGTRNWGYDGVNWFGVQESYGGPEELQRFVDRAHNLGLAVCLDVVYNHFGPDGAYGAAFAPFTSGGSTGWGELINLMGHHSDTVRELIMASVRRWLTVFHADALRLDAVHSFYDPGAYPLLEQMQDVADAVTAETGIPRTLIAESDQNDPRIVRAKAAGGYGLAGQWCDDVHHAIHSAVSGEHHAYYGDFGSPQVLATALERAFWHDGRYSTFRGRTHGRPLHLADQPASAFVTYTTTHDQTGNRAAGDRPSMNLSPAQQVAKAALVYTSPFTPMLFQGEEWGASTPFPFFCSHESEELNRLTTEGRTREFARSGWDANEVPDPADPATFESALLRWDELSQGDHARILAAYRDLLALRHRLPVLTVDDFDSVTASWRDDWGNPAAAAHGQDVVVAGSFHETPVVPESPVGQGRWVRMDRHIPGTASSIPGELHQAVTVLVNLSDHPASVPLPGRMGSGVSSSLPDASASEWTVEFSFTDDGTSASPVAPTGELAELSAWQTLVLSRWQ